MYMQDISNYEKSKQDSHNFYQNIKSLRCPALNNELIHFNAEGFNHLVYKRGRGERSRNDQITRFKLLSRAKTVLEITTTYQEYDEGLTDVRKKRFKKIINESTTVRYWGFVAIIRDFRVKVIVRQIGNGQKNFWSVIPAWNTNQYRGIKIVSQAKGNLSDD